MSDVRWLAEYREEGEVAFRIGRAGEELVAEWVGVVRLTVRRDGSGARFEVAPEAYGPDVEKVRRGSARLLLRHLAGELSLHGAAVGRAGRAVVLLGRSGQGKSTLGAYMCRARGVEFLADDAVALAEDQGRWSVEPLEEDHWLAPDAAAALGVGQGEAWKLPVPPQRRGGRSELAAAVELRYAEGAPRLARLSGLDAMHALVPQVVRFVLDEPELQRRELADLSRLVAAVPVFGLARPRGLGLLDGAADVIDDLLTGKIGRADEVHP